MSAAFREAMWNREKAERKPLPPRLTETTKKGVYEVAKVNDDGRELIVRSGLRWEHADAAAGRMRDRMSDADVGAGWNYVARKKK